MQSKAQSGQMTEPRNLEDNVAQYVGKSSTYGAGFAGLMR